MESCDCEICTSACRCDPGRLVPEDLGRLAKHLNISVDELKAEFLVRVDARHNNETVPSYAPAKRKGKRFVAEPGTAAPDYYADEKGSCIFLDEKGLCTVHEAKPFECAAYMGCSHTFLGRPYRDKEVESYFFKRWKTAVTGKK